MTTTATASQTATLWAMVTRAWTLLKNRRQVNCLSGLTDEQLLDIGLTRSDVRSALQLSLPSDPSLVLSQVAHSRYLSTSVCEQSAILLTYEAPRTTIGQLPATEGHLAA